MRKILQLTPRLLILPFFVATLLILGTTAKSQQSPETWGDFIKSPSVSAGKVLSEKNYDELFRSSLSVFNDMECNESSVNFSPIDHPTGGMPVEGCWFSTSIGLIEKGGYGFRPNGWEVGGYVNSFNSQLFPTKHPDHFIEYKPNESITLRRSDRFIDQTRVTPADTGWDFPVFHEWVYPGASFRLEHTNGSPWHANDNTIYSQIWYSTNGKFMAIWHLDGYFVLVDFETLTIKTISGYDSGFASLAISENGRYVAINIFGVRGLRLIDTESCDTQPDPIYVTSPASCSNRVFAEEFIEFGAQEIYGNLPVFYGNDLLGYYIPSDNEYREYVLRAPNTRRGTNYLALGDSYSSGEGAYFYISGTDDRNNKCHLSVLSYPYLLDYHSNLDSTRSVACSSAKINDLLNTAQYPNSPSNTSLGIWLPGKKPQIEHFATTSPNIVTVGVLGNDIGFRDKLIACLVPGHCYETYEERLSAGNEVNAQFDRLVGLFSRIRSESLNKQPDAKIYAIGYPQIAKLGGHCGKGINLSDKDIEFSNHFILHINGVVRAAAKKAGIFYIEVGEAFGNHRLCGDRPWAMNSLTKGNDSPSHILGPFGNESFHPNYWGHTLLAQTIKTRTQDFSQNLPWPDSSAEPPNVYESLLLHKLEPSGTPAYNYVHDSNLISTSITKDNMHSFSTSGDWLKPYSTATAGFTSVFTEVGQYMVNDLGNVSGDFKPPAELPVGFHTFHIYGVSSEDKELDIYRTVFVGESENDWDGDGTLNNEDSCVDTEDFVLCFNDTVDSGSVYTSDNSADHTVNHHNQYLSSAVDTAGPGDSSKNLGSNISNPHNSTVNNIADTQDTRNRSWVLVAITLLVVAGVGLAVTIPRLIR